MTDLLAGIMFWSMILWIPAIMVGMVADYFTNNDNDRWTFVGSLSAPVIVIVCIAVLFATGNA